MTSLGDPGQDTPLMKERRRAQNRLSQRRRRQKQALEKQAGLGQTPTMHGGVMQTSLQAGVRLPLSDGTMGLDGIDSLAGFPGFDMALPGFSPPWDGSISTLAESSASTIPSADLLGPANVNADLMCPAPALDGLEAPDAARRFVLAFSRSVVPRRDPTFSNNRNETLIHTAARGNDVATLQLLAQAGCGIDERDHQGRTALHAAYEEHHFEAMLWLLERGVDVNAMDKQGRTALSMAVNNKCPVAVRLMLSHGANPLQAQAERVHALSTM